MSKTVVIYSLKNEASVRKVNAWKQKYPKFLFVTDDDSAAIKEAKKGINTGGKIIEFDKPKKAKAKSTNTTKKTTPKKETLEDKILKKLGKKSMSAEAIIDALPKALNSSSIKSAITRMVTKKLLVKTKKGKATTYKAK